MYGDDEPEPGMGVPRRRRPPGGGVYADEMSPEDIFNMFFGGGYPRVSTCDGGHNGARRRRTGASRSRS